MHFFPTLVQYTRRNKILVPFCKCCVIFVLQNWRNDMLQTPHDQFVNVMMSGWGIAALYLTRVVQLFKNSTSETPKVNSIYTLKNIYKQYSKVLSICVWQIKRFTQESKIRKNSTITLLQGHFGIALCKKKKFKKRWFHPLHCAYFNIIRQIKHSSSVNIVC